MSKNRHSAVARALRIAERHYAREQRAAKILSTNFGTSSVVPPPIDVVLMGKLREALGQVDFDLLEACWQRGLLSSRLVEALRMARFLSFTLPSARAAQSETGVPASVLIAEAYLRSGDYTGSTDVFATGRHFESLMDAFMERARTLKDRSELRNTLRDPNVADDISAHDLTECDKLRTSL
jgi:hypothetical protein